MTSETYEISLDFTRAIHITLLSLVFTCIESSVNQFPLSTGKQDQSQSMSRKKTGCTIRSSVCFEGWSRISFHDSVLDISSCADEVSCWSTKCLSADRWYNSIGSDCGKAVVYHHHCHPCHHHHHHHHNHHHHYHYKQCNVYGEMCSPGQQMFKF